MICWIYMKNKLCQWTFMVVGCSRKVHSSGLILTTVQCSILRTAIFSFEVEQKDTHVWSVFLLFLCPLLGSKSLPSPSIQKTRHRHHLGFLTGEASRVMNLCWLAWPSSFLSFINVYEDSRRYRSVVRRK